MKKIIKLECPNCKSSLSATEKREYMFCEYCGAKIILENENEHIIRNIDEAAIKRAETEQLIKLKELEMEEKQREENKKAINNKRNATIVCIIISIVCLIIASNSGDDEHWGYMVVLLMMAIVPSMWLGNTINDTKK